MCPGDFAVPKFVGSDIITVSRIVETTTNVQRFFLVEKFADVAKPLEVEENIRKTLRGVTNITGKV